MRPLAAPPAAANRYLDAGSRAAALYAEARRWLPGGNTRTTVFAAPFPPYADHGRGCLLVDVDGQERIDFLNNYTSLILGHADPGVNQAVVQQLQRGSAFGFPTEHEVALARELVPRVASVDRVRFTNSGTEAVMLAIQLARAATGRPKIAKFEGCYHGSYDYAEVSLAPPAEAMGDPDAPRSVPALPGAPPSIADDVLVLPFNRPEAVERLLQRHAEDVAAVLIDPLPNRAGLIPAQPAFLERLRAATRRHGMLLICDEVLVFRIGYGGAQAVFDFEPDITTFGKIIGGGFPIGAVGAREPVMSLFDPSGGAPRVPHGGTFNANPISAVAGLATLRRLDRQAFARLEELGDLLRDRLRETFARLGMVGQVTGRGSLFRVHLVDRPLVDYRSARWDERTAAKLGLWYTEMLANGIICSPQGLGCLSTPMGPEHIEQFIRASEAALAAVRDRFGAE
jgi:glutamate-1-semialdehyde 2,1-aminomutase